MEHILVLCGKIGIKVILLPITHKIVLIPPHITTDINVSVAQVITHTLVWKCWIVLDAQLTILTKITNVSIHLQINSHQTYPQWLQLPSPTKVQLLWSINIGIVLHDSLSSIIKYLIAFIINIKILK